MSQHLPDNTITAITHLYKAQLPKVNKDNTNPLNYRPISLLEILGKTFERIINKRLRLHLEDQQLLSHKHFGFRPKHSTQDALNVITNYLYISKQRRFKTVLITKDIQKAFNTVWHESLHQV